MSRSETLAGDRAERTFLSAGPYGKRAVELITNRGCGEVASSLQSERGWFRALPPSANTVCWVTSRDTLSGWSSRWTTVTFGSSSSAGHSSRSRPVGRDCKGNPHPPRVQMDHRPDPGARHGCAHYAPRGSGRPWGLSAAPILLHCPGGLRARGDRDRRGSRIDARNF